jgi:hypothetical protein
MWLALFLPPVMAGGSNTVKNIVISIFRYALFLTAAY